MNLDFSICLALVLVSAIGISYSQRFARETHGMEEKNEKLCPPLKMDHGRVECTFLDTVVSCASHMKPKTTATASCNLNYKPEGLGISTLTCLETGTWDNTLLRCYPVCGFYQEDTLIKPHTLDDLVSPVGLYPWHAVVYHLIERRETMVWEQQCGGSLITDQFILTAAHCVNNKRKEDVTIALGKRYNSWDDIEPTEQKRNVSQIYFPEDFSRDTLIFDFSLLHLDKKVKFGGSIMPVCHGFVGGYNNVMDKTLFVVGWSKSENGKSSKQILYKKISLLDPMNCNRMLPLYFPSFEKICLVENNPGKSVTNKGDSGGGLTIVEDGLHYIIGIISFVYQDTLPVLTNISWPYNLHRIQDIIKSQDAQFIWGENQETTSLTKSECVSSDECPTDKVCMDQECRNPCPGVCGNNTVCNVNNHIVICSCSSASLPEHSGCSGHDHCPASKACILGECGDPCEGTCGDNTSCTVLHHVPACACREGYSGNPFLGCAPKACTSSWPPTTGKKKFYLVLTVKLEWHGAYMYCLKNNSRLARIENGEENEIVKKMLDELAIKKIPAIDREFWVGGTDHADEGQWMWLSTGEPVSGFTFWNVGNPNDWGNEDCLSFFEQDPILGYKWNDSICGKKFNFVCEYY